MPFFFMFFFSNSKKMSVHCSQCPPSSQWCAPTTPSSTLYSFTPSPSSAFYSSPCCWCASRAATTARAKKARTAPPSCGLKNLTSVTLPPVWIHLPLACTLALLTKRGLPLLSRTCHRSSQHNAREQIWTPPSDLTVFHCCVELVNELISLKISTLVAACFMLTTVWVCVCVWVWTIMSLLS